MSRDNLLGTRAQVDQLKVKLAEKDEQLNQVLASREMLLRQMTMVEASAIHQHEQNTLLREMMARLVVIFGTRNAAGQLQLVITRDRSRQIDKEFGLTGDQALELAIDTDDVGMVMRVVERLRVVETQEDEGPISVVLGEGGEAVVEHAHQDDPEPEVEADEG